MPRERERQKASWGSKGNFNKIVKKKKWHGIPDPLINKKTDFLKNILKNKKPKKHFYILFRDKGEKDCIIPSLWNSGIKVIFPNSFIYIKTCKMEMEMLEEGL